MDQDRKRQLREEKRAIKRAGNKRLRRGWKRAVTENPEDAHRAKLGYGRYGTAKLNGADHDLTRRIPQSPFTPIVIPDDDDDFDDDELDDQ